MNVFSIILIVLICVCLIAVIGMQFTKIFWAWKSKGESLKPHGVEDKSEKGGKEE